MAPPSDNGPPQTDFQVPEGWVFVSKPNRKGGFVKYYTNILGQRFYSESDLMRNIRDAKKREHAIYAPDFKPPATGPFSMSSKGTGSSSNAKHVSENNDRHGELTSKNKVSTKSKNQKEVESHHEPERASAMPDEALGEDEVQCARALLEISAQRNIEHRASRRLAGHQPELQIDFDFNRAMEYIIKDKHQY